MTADNKTYTYDWGSCRVLTPFYDGGINTNTLQVRKLGFREVKTLPQG